MLPARPLLPRAWLPTWLCAAPSIMGRSGSPSMAPRREGPSPSPTRETLEAASIARAYAASAPASACAVGQGWRCWELEPGRCWWHCKQLWPWLRHVTHAERTGVLQEVAASNLSSRGLHAHATHNMRTHASLRWRRAAPAAHPVSAPRPGVRPAGAPASRSPAPAQRAAGTSSFNRFVL